MNQAQLDRYARHIRLTSIGEAGQQAICDASVLIIGMGGLGAPAAMYLAAGGVGELILCDYDIVETSNLQRQIIHLDKSVGEHKVESAKQTINALNPECQVRTIEYQMDEKELFEQIQQADIVLDCTDNFPTRFEINRGCVASGTPLVIGAAIRLEGQVMSYQPGSACYQCLYPQSYENAESCELEGVLGPVVGVIGSMQALQAMLILAGQGEPLRNKLSLFDAAAMEWRTVVLPRHPSCPVCSDKD